MFHKRNFRRSRHFSLLYHENTPRDEQHRSHVIPAKLALDSDRGTGIQGTSKFQIPGQAWNDGIFMQGDGK